LAHLVGIKLSREGIFYERVFLADKPEGRLICDEVVPASEMDAAIEAQCAPIDGRGFYHLKRDWKPDSRRMLRLFSIVECQ
jgi:hypothetical protein